MVGERVRDTQGRAWVRLRFPPPLPAGRVSGGKPRMITLPRLTRRCRPHGAADMALKLPLPETRQHPAVPPGTRSRTMQPSFATGSGAALPKASSLPGKSSLDQRCTAWTPPRSGPACLRSARPGRSVALQNGTTYVRAAGRCALFHSNRQSGATIAAGQQRGVSGELSRSRARDASARILFRL